MLIQDQPQIAI